MAPRSKGKPATTATISHYSTWMALPEVEHDPHGPDHYTFDANSVDSVEKRRGE